MSETHNLVLDLFIIIIIYLVQVQSFLDDLSVRFEQWV